MLDHYLHTAHAGSLLLKPARRPIDLAEPLPGAIRHPLLNRDEALGWFSTEHQVLLAIGTCEADGSDRHTWQLGWALFTYLHMCSCWQEKARRRRSTERMTLRRYSLLVACSAQVEHGGDRAGGRREVTVADPGRPRLIVGAGAATLVDPELAEYREYPVPAGLRHQVRAVWQVRTLAGGWRHPVFPDGYGDVVVTGGLRMLAVGPSRRTHHQPLPVGSTVAGVRLRPGALSILTGLPADELCERVVPLGRLAPDGRSTVASLMAALSRLAEPRPSGQDCAVRACRLLDVALRAPSIRSVADAVGVAERTLRWLFARHVGLSPSVFHQVRRMQRALALSGRSLPVADIAHRTGYSDQAHMCRQLRSLTGLTPGSLLTAGTSPQRR